MRRLLFALLLFLPLSTLAAGHPPKIGLVLSGGAWTSAAPRNGTAGPER